MVATITGERRKDGALERRCCRDGLVLDVYIGERSTSSHSYNKERTTSSHSHNKDEAERSFSLKATVHIPNGAVSHQNN